MERRGHAVRILVAITCLATSAHAGDQSRDADALEVKSVREQGTVIHDGKGHYLAFLVKDLAADEGEAWRIMFYGDGTTFYRVMVRSHAAEGSLTTWMIQDQRVGLDVQRSQLVRKDSTYTMICRTETATPMTPLPAADARTLLAKAAFKTTRMDRVAFALGRDGTIYYYVDVASGSDANTDFRVYTGKRGAMKLLKVTTVAADTSGAVFTSKAGTLRISVQPMKSKPSRNSVRPLKLTWAKKRAKEIELSTIPIDDNLELVYDQLGIYIGKPFGLPCDDI